MRALFVHTAHETSGAARIRHSLRPLDFGGVRIPANLGRNASRERGRIFSCRHPRRRVTQYPRDVSDRTDRPRRTGYPLSRVRQSGYARVRTSLCTLHARSRVQRASGIPCALCFERAGSFQQTSGALRRENNFRRPGQAKRDLRCAIAHRGTHTPRPSLLKKGRQRAACQTNCRWWLWVPAQGRDDNGV